MSSSRHDSPRRNKVSPQAGLPHQGNDGMPNTAWNFEELDRHDHDLHPSPHNEHELPSVALNTPKFDEQDDDLYTSTPPQEYDDAYFQRPVQDSIQNEPPLNADFEDELLRALEESVKDHQAHTRRFREERQEDDSQLREVLEQSKLDAELHEKRRERCVQEAHEAHAAELSKAVEASLRADGECKFCGNAFTDPVRLSCQHVFCSKCLEWWGKCSDSCPICGKRCLVRNG